MAEYIKREVALAMIRPDDPSDERCAVTVATAKRLVRHALTAAPAADVAPVMRCKGCKHLVAVNVNGKGIPTCRVSGMEVAPDEFCSRGEAWNRRADDG